MVLPDLQIKQAVGQLVDSILQIIAGQAPLERVFLEALVVAGLHLGHQAMRALMEGPAVTQRGMVRVVQAIPRELIGARRLMVREGC